MLRDDVALRNRDITNPRATTDVSGMPEVTFGFNRDGRTKFQAMTAQIARRGQDVSTLGQSLNQHLAIALDNQLLTVPSISYQSYPDGITGANGGDIAAGFSRQSAKDLAAELHAGPLPLQLRLTHR